MDQRISTGDLLAMIGEKEVTIASLRKRIADLEQQLAIHMEEGEE